MIQDFELAYSRLVDRVLHMGERRETRNGATRGLFGTHLKFDCNGDRIPLIQGRKMYPAGVLGEFAAMIRGPECLDDFKKWGCNYWDNWADEDGLLDLDYGNAWQHQLDWVIDRLKTDPTNRRLLISGWSLLPWNIEKLSLPCCHYAYQFYVRDGVFLDMMWMQRSVDMMIGLPSDMLFAALWLKLMANETGYQAGSVTMSLGDCHVYDEHIPGAREYLSATWLPNALRAPTMKLHLEPGMSQRKFEPSMADISYESLSPIKFELK